MPPMSNISKTKVEIEALVKKAQQGNSTAFNELYRMFVDSIFRFCYFKTKSEEAAQDITSETFLRVWRYLGRYKAQNFRAYLYTIARNIINDYYKAQKKTVRLPNFLEIEDKKPSYDHQLIQEENKKELHKAISKLPKHYAEVVILRFIEELSVKETAQIINKPGVWVRVVQHRALKKMKIILKNNE